MDIFNFPFDKQKCNVSLVTRYSYYYFTCFIKLILQYVRVGGKESVLLVPNNANGPAVTYSGGKKLSLFEVVNLR